MYLPRYSGNFLEIDVVGISARLDLRMSEREMLGENAWTGTPGPIARDYK